MFCFSAVLVVGCAGTGTSFYSFLVSFQVVVRLPAPRSLHTPLRTTELARSADGPSSIHSESAQDSSLGNVNRRRHRFGRPAAGASGRNLNLLEKDELAVVGLSDDVWRWELSPWALMGSQRQDPIRWGTSEVSTRVARFPARWVR